MSSSRIQLQVIKKSSDSKTKRIRYLVKTNQMLVKMMTKFCQYIDQPRSNVHFYHNGRQLEECETAISAHLVTDDTIEAVLLDSGMPESYERNITFPNEQVVLADQEKIPIFQQTAPSIPSDTPSVSNNQSFERAPVQHDQLKSEPQLDEQQLEQLNSVECFAESNTAKIARLEESVENFLVQVCETGTYELQSVFRSPKIEGYETEIRSLRSRCEKDKLQYLDGLKAATKRQEWIVKSIKDDFNARLAALTAENNLHIEEKKKMKQKIADQSKLIEHLNSYPKYDFIKKEF